MTSQFCLLQVIPLAFWDLDRFLTLSVCNVPGKVIKTRGASLSVKGWKKNVGVSSYYCFFLQRKAILGSRVAWGFRRTGTWRTGAVFSLFSFLDRRIYQGSGTLYHACLTTPVHVPKESINVWVWRISQGDARCWDAW